MDRSPRFQLYSFKTRLLTVLVAFILCFLAVLGRVFYLQILKADYYTDKAKSQHERIVTLEPRRGRILDKNGRILAVSIQLKSLFAKPGQIDSPTRAARLLSPILNTPYHKLLIELKSKSNFVWIKRKLPPDQTKQIQKLNLSGIGFIEEFRRFYPNGNFAGQLLGYTGIDSQGLEGVENKYESLLAGKPAAYIVEKEGMYRTVPLSNIPKKIPDQYALHLTIDSTIQHFAEKALRDGVIKTRADRGNVIALHSKTGAILAMASYPGFDPNRYQQYSRALQLNRATTSGYEPGSTFKMVTIAAALNEGMISPDQEFFCENGKYKIGRNMVHDTSPHGIMTLKQVLKKSSNICAAKIGMSMSPAKFHEYILRFGFGQRPNSGVAAEASGRVISPKKWQTIDHANISFGQAILVSPLQMVSAANVFANEGQWVPPYIVEHLRDNNGKKLQEIKDNNGKLIQSFGKGVRSAVVEASVAALVKEYLVSVTQQGGTAEQAAIKGYQIAGKTGTSQIYDQQMGRYSNTRYIASFVGFAPASEPLVTVLVVVEQPRTSYYGGSVAAPIFKEIVQRTLLFEDVLPFPEESNADSSFQGKTVKR
ncbi:MAG: penicillin-binding protein 2 [SAR324 cluster bacterium]|nr:penicillin-binding protein 2 [SAR324 cluster bacterium]MDP6743234.1 penicillin-binding protein 2 [SAR324 cluster bacterium]MEC7887155.1 penicillin-binding protein 2 [SAR324 cluster bacterium]MEC9012902.1 penicillin-binding protein 2 [SAR324 cluster bacterium]MED5483659.1 penicillin-binding protein 2 [SAR324 cluster bacterium]